MAEGIPFWDLKPDQAILIESATGDDDCYEDVPDSVARWYSPTIVADGLTLAMNLQSPGLSDIVRVRRNSERPLLLRKNTVVGKVILLDNSMAQPAIVSATPEHSLPLEGEGG